MRLLTAASVGLLGAFALAACTTTDPYTGQQVRNNTGTGALAGALGGAALGYLTNTNKSSEGRKNALIGAGVGALAGAAAGNYMDRQQAELRQQMAGTGVDVIRQGDNIILNMPSDVTFAVDQSDIQPRFYTVLDDVARTLNAYPQTLVDVVGHADSTGADAYNRWRATSSIAAGSIRTASMWRAAARASPAPPMRPLRAAPRTAGWRSSCVP